MPYPTRPFKCWAKAKENRHTQWSDVMTARERGVPLSMGGTGHSIILTGLGEFAYLPGEPYGAEVSRYPELERKCAEAVDAKGYASDLCGYLRNYWGSAFIRETPWGKFPKPDFVIQGHMCDSHGKWFRRMADEFGVPYFVIDHPERHSFHVGSEHSIRYEVDQYLEMIEWLEKVTGKQYDDELLIDAVVNARDVGGLWADIIEMNKAKPAPMDMKSMFALSNPAVRTRYLTSTVAFYKELRDEMAERVRDGIAAVANEKKRLIHDNLPPWFALHIFRFMEEFGAVCVGSQYQWIWGLWQRQPDGSFKSATYKAIAELPRPRNRREAVESLVEVAGNSAEYGLGGLTGDSGRDVTPWIAREWGAGGAIFHLNRGCEGWTRGKMEARLAVQQMGIPTAVYEGNGSDRRDFNEPQVLSRLQAFFESMGLTREGA